MTMLLLLLPLTTALVVSCASGPPTLENRRVREKLDLRLQLALSGEPTEDLGRFVRVIVTLVARPTSAQMDSLRIRGAVIDQSREFVTMTVAVTDLARLAAYKPVRRVDLDLPNAPPPRAAFRPDP